VTSKSELLGNSVSHIWIDLIEVANHDFLDALSALAEWAADVGDPVLSVGLGEHVLPESSWLLVVVVFVGVGISSSASVHLLWVPLG